MADLLKSLGLDLRCKRKFGRAVLGIPAKLSLIDGEYPCELIDISLQGARIACSRTPKPGVMAALKIDGVELFGSIVWRSQTSIGLRFDENAPKDLIVRLNELVNSRMGYTGHKGRIAANHWANGS